jgi:hypothetical protein
MDPKAHQEAFTREMMEHARLYPRLSMPIVAFRNLGNLRFEEVTDVWGTTNLGVHQGIAFGDFDGDGDLDFVVNNLNGNPGSYPTTSLAPGWRVRLRAFAKHSRIGAKIKFRRTVPGKVRSRFAPIPVRFGSAAFAARLGGWNDCVAWAKRKRSVVVKIETGTRA